jgi:hypothetical protein
MSTKSRTLLFSIGVIAAIGIIAILYRNADRTARAEKPTTRLLTSVIDIKPSSHKFMIDLYGKAPNGEMRRLLFLRKADGTLKAWYFPMIGRQPATPKDDWFIPGSVCDPFVIDNIGEDIKCVVTDADKKQTYNLRWTWEGKSSAPLGFFSPEFNANLKPVPGFEEKGNFVFEASSTILAKDKK